MGRLAEGQKGQDSRVRSSVGLGQSPLVPNLRLRVLPEIMQRHAASHGGDEDDDAGRQRRKTFQRRPRAQADKPPTYSKQRRPNDKWPVDIAPGLPEASGR